MKKLFLTLFLLVVANTALATTYVPVTATWTDVKTTYSLVLGTTYVIDNTSGDTVHYQKSDSVPTVETGHSIHTGQWRLITIGPESLWMRSRSNNSPTKIYISPVDSTAPESGLVTTSDIDRLKSDTYNFSGTVYDLFNDLHSVITDVTLNNPKEVLIHFRQTIVANTLGLGAVTGNFSNTEVQIGNSGGVFTTVVDENTIDSKYTTRTFQLPVTAGFNAIKLRFHTTDAISLSNLAIVKTTSVVSRLQGVKDDGTVGDVVISNSHRLRTVSQPYTFAVAEGDIPGHLGVLKFGTRSTVVAGTESTCWEGPTDRYIYMATAQQLQVSSDSIEDDSTGDGIRSIKILGLDSNYDEIDEIIALDGTTQVTTVNSYLRIFRAYGVTCGSSLVNEGTITIYNNAGTTVQAIINPGDGQTLMAMWTVPRGKTAYIIRGGLSTSSNKGARVSFFVKQSNGGILYPWQIKYRGYLFSGAIQVPIDIPYVIPELVDIEITVLTPGSAGATALGGTFELWYE